MAAVAPAKRARIAAETLEIYAPIAHRLGLNQTYRELQELSFQHRHPWRFGALAVVLPAKESCANAVCSGGGEAGHAVADPSDPSVVIPWVGKKVSGNMTLVHFRPAIGLEWFPLPFMALTGSGSKGLPLPA